MECCGIQDSDYLSFRGRIYRKALEERTPLAGSMEITARCNLRCVHCYMDASTDQGEELSLSEIRTIVDQLAEEGCLWLLVTGGEPLLRSDFRDIYRHIKSRGIMPILFTNGTLLTDETADLLESMPPFVVEVSIYGSTEDTYESVTGIPGSFRECMKGIGRLLKRGIRVYLKSMAITLNSHEIKGMRDLAEELGVPFRFDTMINCSLDGERGPADYRLPPREVIQLDEDDTERMEAWVELAKNFRLEDDHNRVFQCGAGLCTFHIDWRGYLSVCMMYRESSYDLRKGTFSDGWRLYIPGVLERQWSRDVPCRSCSLKSMCGQCPGWGYLENGDPEEPVEYLCRIAGLRADALGLSGAGIDCSEDLRCRMEHLK